METDYPLFGKCPYATVQRLFSGKWSILILYHLSGKTYRFNELQRQLCEITQSTLAKQLRALEEFGLVNREIFLEIPPKVEYSLTQLGVDFIPVLKAFEAFGEKYISYLHERR
jgi:DNA-binding HxlR family transcriptional regulator